MAYKVKKFGDYVERRTFSRAKNTMELTDLLEIQKKSYNWFLEEGIKEIFEDCAAMVGTGNNFFNNGEMMGRTFEKEEKDFIETSIFKDFYKIKQKRNNNTYFNYFFQF